MTALSRNNIILFAMWAFYVHDEAITVTHGQLRRALAGLHTELPDSYSLTLAMRELEDAVRIRICGNAYQLTGTGRREARRLYAQLGFTDGDPD